jgi:hypothetical protein
MIKKLSVLMGVGLTLAMILTACQPTPAQPTIDLQGLVSTSVAQTLAANASNPTQNPLPTSSFPTATLLPSSTPIPTLPVLPTAQPIATISVPCLHMSGNDVTIPDNTKMVPGTAFTKTWRLYNNGSCTWPKSTVLYFFSGDQLGAPASVALPSDVLSGSIVDISVPMVAPSAEGTYTSNWKLKTSNGTVFGSGDKSVAIWVTIIVANVPFAVTNVVITVDNASPTSNPCSTGHTFSFTAAITSTSPGTVTYYWSRSDGGTGSPESVAFTGPETKNVSMTWLLTSSYSGTVSVYIDNPNHQLFGPGGSFTYTCTP